jgi:hypothetical protein
MPAGAAGGEEDEVVGLGRHCFSTVMAGLVPAIHASGSAKQGVDARHKAGHDEIIRFLRLPAPAP